MKQIIAAIFLLANSYCFGEVVTYEPPDNVKSGNKFIHGSTEYKVELIQKGKTYPVFVYSMDALHYTNNCKATAWVNFSFDGEVRVRVYNLTNHKGPASILPRSKNIQAVQQENITEFTISAAGQFSVEYQRGLRIEHPLLIFANGLEKNVPDASDTSVLYFGPGLHQIGEKFLIPKGKKVYLHGSAYVKGQFYGENLDGVEIFGRGIMSGEDYAARTADHMIHLRNATNVSIEGITMIHAPRFMITLSGKKHHIDNVKMMGWWFSADGISAGEEALIENCFFKVNDDAIKLYQNKTEAKNCVIWQMENGAPFQLGWNGTNDYSNCYVHDIDVIRVEHEWDNENEAVICAIHGGRGNKTNFLFEHIRIDNSNWRIFHLVTKPNRWGQWNTERGSMSDMVFRNIEMYGEQLIPSLIMGHDEKHPVYNLKFENIIINGKRTKGERKNFIVDSETTWGISFDGILLN
jgi:hypothetical protein